MKKMFIVSFLQDQGVCHEEAPSHIYFILVLAWEWVEGQGSSNCNYGIIDKLDICVPFLKNLPFSLLTSPQLTFVSHTHWTCSPLASLHRSSRVCTLYTRSFCSSWGCIRKVYLFDLWPVTQPLIGTFKKLPSNPSCHLSFALALKLLSVPEFQISTLLFIWYLSLPM